MVELRIPEGINYECTGCGKCCSGWAVPMTQDDYERISAWSWDSLHEKFKGRNLFRQLKDYERADSPYDYAIVKGDDGHCPFLVDNLCFIHSQYGSKAKPAICQLFPYCFNETPSGIYATVSFYSVGAVYNSGRPLTEQREYLESKWDEFTTLNPDHHPNWSELKLTVGAPMTWEEYLEHEKGLLAILSDRKLSLDERMLKGSEHLAALLPARAGAPSPGAAGPLKKLDKHLLVALHKIYFPVKPLGRGEGDFNAGRFFYQILFQGQRIAIPGKSFKFEELHDFAWPDGDQEIEDLLYRYFYSRIFGKLYFGAGFGQLSLITGFHHLVLVYALVKLQAKATALGRGATAVTMLDMVATVRNLEKRMGECKLGGYEAAIWELLMSSPSRVRRVIAWT